MSYAVIIPKPTQKQIDKLPTEIRAVIVERIVFLGDEPRPSGVVKLKGADSEYRIRIGDYRVRYEIDDKDSVVIILHCRHRKDVYRD
jgi:mRNA interferase RelE/StbE